MSIQHYDGFLGTFDYDDTQFELRDANVEGHGGLYRTVSLRGLSGAFYAEDLLDGLPYDKCDDFTVKYLHYIGSETDGSKIKIPDGIKSCLGMFAGTDIESVPAIPDSVVYITDMYLGCKNLKQIAALHNRFKDEPYHCVSHGAYSQCNNIESIVIPRDCDSHFIPYTHSFSDIAAKYEGESENKNNMRCHSSNVGAFAYDPNEFIPLSDGVRYIGTETDGSKIKVPKGILNANHMFAGCELTSCPAVPKSVWSECKETMFEETNLSSDEINWAFDNRDKFLSLSDGDVIHSGKFGTFVYNPNEFKVLYNGVHYIGTETDGSKIKIPDGIVDTTRMFKNNKSLVTPPVIPASVKICDYMFENCSSLKQLPVIPESVASNCRETMFEGTHLSIDEINWVFNNRGKSLSLSDATMVHDGTFGAFIYNPNEFKVSSDGVHYIGTETDGSKIKIPDGIVDTSYMFADNKSLLTPPTIPDGVISCVSMFENCSSLKQPPVIPTSVKNGALTMLNGCVRSVKLKGRWNAEHRGQQYDEQMNISSQQRDIPGFDFE